MRMSTAPDRTEAAAYYFTYIDKAGEGEIIETLDRQLGSTVALLKGIGEEQS